MQRPMGLEAAKTYTEKIQTMQSSFHCWSKCDSYLSSVSLLFLLISRLKTQLAAATQGGRAMRGWRGCCCLIIKSLFPPYRHWSLFVCDGRKWSLRAMEEIKTTDLHPGLRRPPNSAPSPLPDEQYARMCVCVCYSAYICASDGKSCSPSPWKVSLPPLLLLLTVAAIR